MNPNSSLSEAGARLRAEDIAIGGDVAGRDKIVSTVIYQGVIPGQARRGELPQRQPFFGRAEELARIAEALDPEARGWGVLIDGPGGIGKTALAIEAGHLAPANHFASKIFLSAKVRELTPAGEAPLDDFMLPNYQALLIELGRELGVAEITQLPSGQRAAEVRRALENRKTLLILDNLETLEETERTRLYQFLSRLPASCKAIVTSRRREDVEARVIRLDRLGAQAAQALIASLAERRPLLARATEDERRELYEVTQGNPLLIKWVAGQLGRGRCRTVAEACGFLGAAPADNDPLEFILGDLAEGFSENELKILGALSHFDGLARVEWIAEAAGIAVPAARTALEDLADRALLTASGDHWLFYLPPLVVKYLRSRQPGIIAETGERLTNQVFDFLFHDEETIHSPARFPHVEAQWSRVAAALEVFLQGDNVRLQLLCGTLDRFYEFSGRWDEWLSLCARAEDRAAAVNDAYNAGQRAFQAGYVFSLRGQPEATAACAERAEAYWHNATDDVHASVLLLRASAFRLQNNHASARVAAEAALTIFRGVAAGTTSVVNALNELALVEAAAGHPEQAEAALNEAMQISSRLPMEYLALSVTNLADLQRALTRWTMAESLARDALAMAERVRWKMLVGRACRVLGAALLAQGQPGEAQPYARRALDIATQLQTPEWAAAAAVLRQCEPETPAQ